MSANQREAVEVLAEVGDAGVVQVGGSDLRALAEGDAATCVRGGVGEAVPAGEALRERHGGAVGSVRHREEAAVVLVHDARAEVVERVGEQCHQLVVGVLAERRGDRRRVERAQLGGGPCAVLREAVAQAERDRPVARAFVALAQRREPAGAEVDRVEREVKRGALLGRPVDQVVVRVRLGWSGQCRRVRRDRVGIDPHVGRARRDPRASGADLVDERHAASVTAPCSWSSSQRFTGRP